MTDIRVGVAGDADRYLATDLLVWFSEPFSAPAEVLLTGLHPDQRFAAELPDGPVDTYPGVYGVYPMRLTLPGRPEPVPCAGLTWVGVHPDHRRRGVLTAMLRHHLEEVHATPGTHLSALHASEPAIYGRHGYGMASVELSVGLGRGTSFTAPGLEDEAGRTRTRLANLEDEGVGGRMHAIDERTARPGAIVGDADYYRRVCIQLPESLRGKEPSRVLFAERDGVDVGYAFFRRVEKWERNRPAGEVSVRRISGDAAARLALLRRLTDLDLTGSVEVNGVGVDDGTLHWVGGPRGAQTVETYDSLWIRLVDLAEALPLRRYAAPCDVVVEVDDASAPWNAGRWRIVVDDAGRAEVTRSTADADLRLPVQLLGAAYLGGTDLAALQRSGLVVEQRPGATAGLWRSMRATSAPAPAIEF